MSSLGIHEPLASPDPLGNAFDNQLPPTFVFPVHHLPATEGRGRVLYQSALLRSAALGSVRPSEDRKSSPTHTSGRLLRQLTAPVPFADDCWLRLVSPRGPIRQALRCFGRRVRPGVLDHPLDRRRRSRVEPSITQLAARSGRAAQLVPVLPVLHLVLLIFSLKSRSLLHARALLHRPHLLSPASHAPPSTSERHSLLTLQQRLAKSSASSHRHPRPADVYPADINDPSAGGPPALAHDHHTGDQNALAQAQQSHHPVHACRRRSQRVQCARSFRDRPFRWDRERDCLGQLAWRWGWWRIWVARDSDRWGARR